ncbi:MAG: cyanophycin synthetase [Clostridium sp.]|nr:cyanophycin synthetase [Clostridium sp.]MDY3828186.1 cyanophycin synthetase [Clostridium sp.]
MKIIKSKVFKGRNIYSHKKCIRLDVDLCGYANIPSKDIEGFNSRLLSNLPELKEHRCGIDEEHGFVKRLSEGTYLAHICEHIIIAIQNRLNIEVCYGKSREIQGELYYIVFQYEYVKVAIEAAHLAVDLINSLINNKKIDFLGRMRILQKIYNSEIIGPSTRAIKMAAERYGLPVSQIGDGSIYQIGYGKQLRYIEATIGNDTSCIASDIASDKIITKQLLINQNIPVPKGIKANNVLNLIKNARKIGYPLVLKPRYGSKGDGVVLNIQNEKELVIKYNSMKRKYDELMLEESVRGYDYRVCVVNYEVVAVSLRIPPFIIGDGVHSIRELIRLINDDPNRGFGHEKPLTKIKIEEELLEEIKKQGYELQTIPDINQKILLRETANLSKGAIAVDCSDDICKENIELCIRAAKTIGLDICGIDIKALDISKPLIGQGGIIEVNSAPGIRMHEFPLEGRSRDVGEAILKLQYNGVPINIPVISITGTNGKTTTTRMISHILKNTGLIVGMTSTEGIYIGDTCIDCGDDTGFYSAQTVLQNREVEVAVLETARGGIIRNGLAYDLADVAVITNITEDHLGIDSVESMEEMVLVKSLVAEAVKEDGYVVINADDKWSLKVVKRIKEKNIIYFSKSSNNKFIKEAIKSNNIAIYIENDYLTLYEEGKFIKLIKINNIPITLNGILEFNIENVLSACACLVALKVDYKSIIRGLKTYKLNSKYNMGRFNIHEINGIKVILDYGHNIEGYNSVIKAIKKIANKHIFGVIGVPGDRKDEDILKIGTLCGKSFDKVIIKEDKDRRGRKEGEVAKILEKGVRTNLKDIKIILDELEAFKNIFKVAEPGDVIVVFYEKIDLLIQYLNELEVASTELKIINI